MGCRESKLAVATTEPIKRSKSASSRSSSRRVDNTNPTTTATTNVHNDKTIAIGLATLEAANKDAVVVVVGAAKAVQQKRSVESKGRQTMEHCPEEGVNEKSKSESSQHDGQRGSNKAENNVVVPEKETTEEEGDEHKENVVFGEENKKTESGLAKENELECEKQGKTKMDTFETREQDHVKIEEGKAQSANDQVQATKEEAGVGKPNEVDSGAIVDAQNELDDEIEVVEEGAKNAESTKVEVEAMTANDGEDAKKVESTEAEVATVVVEGTTENTKGEVADAEEEAVEVELTKAEVEAEAIDDKVAVVEKEEAKEAEPTEAEVEALVEEETEKIALQNEDDQVSKDVEKVEPIELEDGTLNEEKTENSDA